MESLKYEAGRDIAAAQGCGVFLINEPAMRYAAAVRNVKN